MPVLTLPIVELDFLGHFPVRKCQDVIVRHIDNNGSIWASRGLDLYRARPGDTAFHRVATIPTGRAVMWPFRFDEVRRVTGMHDLVQLYWTHEETLIAFSGGFVWRRERDSDPFERVLELQHWGLGVGRGVLQHGIAQLSCGRLFFGEYFRNSEDGAVKLFSSDDDGRTWFVIKEFPPGEVRHVHAVITDPYTNHLWVCTGDTDSQSKILCSTDRGESFDVVGTGSQRWRTCQLLFTETGVYWGADTSSTVAYRDIVRMSRHSNAPEPLARVDGAVESGAQVGPDLMMFGTSRNGLEVDSDESPSLWIGREGSEWYRLPVGNWRRKDFRRAAAVQLVANRQAGVVVVSLVNVSPDRCSAYIVDPAHLQAFITAPKPHANG